MCFQPAPLTADLARSQVEEPAEPSEVEERPALAPYLVAAVSGWGVSRSRRPDVSPAFGVSRRGVYLVECISYAPLTSLYLVETRISYRD